MDAGRLQQLEELYHAARYSSPGQREALLAQADPELRREVESLLAQDSSGDKILDHPPDEWPPESTETEVAVGSQRGPYKIEGVLGAGGMGQVYKARDTRLGRAVALKVVRKRFSARFEREARAISSLNHPHICTLYDVGPDYLVMELVEGETLATRLKKGKLRIDDTLRYATQIAEALAEAHAKGIIHRDLKPSNIMVTKEGRVKVLDFGLAKLTEPAPPAEDEETGALEPHTEDGAIVGTISYMSPEQAESKPVDARSDIFSFGAVLYEMATGARAFQGSSKLSTLSAILRENPKPPSEVASGVPRELDRIVARCLRKDPARRFQNMTDMKLALQDLKEESESGATGQPVLAAKPKSRPLLVTAAVAVVLAAVAVLYLLRSPSKPMPPPRAIPLTAYRGSERHPSFSPDGNQVAFDWNGEKQDNYDIYVKLVSGGAPLRLTTNPAEDIFPAWSPDGSQIAFSRMGAGIYLVSPLGGQERRLTDANAFSLTWMPDGQSLLARIWKDTFQASIFQISMGGEMRKVTSPPATSQDVLGAGDWWPAVSPDGQSVAFARYTNTSDLYVSPITGGEARRLTNDRREIHGLVWINNREILFSSNRAGGRTLWRIAADGRSEPQPAPGVDGSASHPTITHAAKSPARVAYQRTELDYNIWRMEVSVPENGPARIVTGPAPVIASTRVDTSPQFSPDGKRMVFSSDRSGYMEIWVSNSDGSNATQLTTLRSGGSESSRSGGPSWSPDGQKIVFESLASGDNAIWMVNADGGSPKRLTMGPSIDGRPSWSRDGRWIYFRSDRSGPNQIWKMPSAKPYKPAVQVTENEGRDATESADGKLLYFTKFATGLWSLPVAGGDETPVLESVPPGGWDVTDKGVYFLNGQLIQFFSFANRKLTRIGEIGKPKDPYRRNFSVSTDGRWIAWSQLDHEDSDLMLLENFR